MKFNQFSIHSSVLNNISKLGFENATPIQEKTLPIALNGTDVIGIAETGSGKTAAFLIPIISNFMAHPEATALVLAPTRELAVQIESNWHKLTEGLKLSSAVLMGGMSMQPQLRALGKKPRLIIATPGRLVDHLSGRNSYLHILFSHISVLVLDEADRMLDMGFAPDLNTILKSVPKKRQTLFFTATWDDTLNSLTQKYLYQPEQVIIGTPSKAVDTVEQSAMYINGEKKNDVLLDELNKRTGSVLVFARTKHRTDRIAKYLNSYNVGASRIHGGRTQAQRTAALKDFRDGKCRVLVATDIAARGIDVNDIAHVINFDVPRDPADYIHRIGRTGRAGKTGKAVSFISHEEKAQWLTIEKLLKKSGSNKPGASAQSHSSPKPHSESKAFTIKPSGNPSIIKPKGNSSFAPTASKTANNAFRPHRAKPATGMKTNNESEGKLPSVHFKNKKKQKWDMPRNRFGN